MTPALCSRRPSLRGAWNASPLSHLSIELGHLYMEDFAGGPESLRRHFRRIAPWAAAAAQTVDVKPAGNRARVSTCFLIDDYFTRFSSPDVVIPQLVAAARGEPAWSSTTWPASPAARSPTDIPLARSSSRQLVADPAPGTTGVRPPPTETGWLCNGQRSPTRWRSRRWPTSVAAAGAERRQPALDLRRRRAVGRRERASGAGPARSSPRSGSCSGSACCGTRARRWPSAWQVEELPGDWDRLPAVVEAQPAGDGVQRVPHVLGAAVALPADRARGPHRSSARSRSTPPSSTRSPLAPAASAWSSRKTWSSASTTCSSAIAPKR